MKGRDFMEEITNKLNEFLSDLNVFFRKLQNYHWNIEGKDFFVLHEKLEEYYNKIYEQIDEVAEHMLILGIQPLGTLKDYLQTTNIKEAENKKIKTNELLNSVIEDINILLKKVTEIKEEAENKKLYATSSLADEYILEYGKMLWMLNQTNK